MTQKGKLTGWHVLFILCVFFGVMVAVNVVFTVFAVKTFPGEQVEKSYVQGIHYNDVLKDKERQAALGWAAEIGFEKQDNGAPRLVSNWFDKSGEPMTQLTVNAKIVREVSEEGMSEFTLSADGPGRYYSDMSELGAGIWRIEVTAANSDNEIVTAHKTLTW